MKYRIVGYLDIFFGVVYALVQIVLLVFVYPKMMSLYESTAVQVPAVTGYSRVFSAIFSLLFVCAVVVGVKLLKKPNDQLFWLGVIILVALLTLSGYFIGISVLGIITPLYNITNSL